MSKPKVFNKRRRHEIPVGAIYIGRPTQWGNPFSKGSRAQNIEEFHEYAESRICHDPQWLEPLRDKHLVCWCAPNPCHGDVILNLLEQTSEPEPYSDEWCELNEPEYPDNLGIMADLCGNPERI